MQPSRSKPALSKKRQAERFGQRAEALAALFLTLKFYSIRARRYKTPMGEIDIVAQKGRVTVFVEVKARRSNGNFLEASEAVDTSRLTRAAQYWQIKHPREPNADYRFDVIFLAPGRWPRHLIDAFTCEICS